MALFISIFLLSGLIPFGMLLTLFFARARLQMRRDEVTGSIGFLFLRKKKTISTNSISDVGLALDQCPAKRRNSNRWQLR